MGHPHIFHWPLSGRATTVVWRHNETKSQWQRCYTAVESQTGFRIFLDLPKVDFPWLHFFIFYMAKLQSQTKLLEKVFPTMSTFVRNKTIFNRTPLRKEILFSQFYVASNKRPGIRLSFEYTTTLLSGEGGEREEPVQLRCLEKCSTGIQFSQHFCPRL